jgi:phosphate:Na+ symporter
MDRDREQLDQIARRDAQVDVLEAEILEYLGRLRQASLTEQESQKLQVLMIAIINMENLADVIETDLVELARCIMDRRSRFSDASRGLVAGMYDSVCRGLELTVKAIRDNDQPAAEEVLLLHNEIRSRAEQLLARGAEQSAMSPEAVETVRLEISLVDTLRRIYTLAKRTARLVLPAPLAAGE